MGDLKKLQKMFHGAVVRDDQTFVAEIRTGGKITPNKRLSIYAYAYKARLRGVLREDFPTLHIMLGDGDFDQMCDLYTDNYPSHNASLRFFGQHMADFLSETDPYAQHVVLAEMARFEWGFRDVFDATDRLPVTIEDVATIPPAAWTMLRIYFHPATVLHSFSWNVAALWSSVKEDADNPVFPEKLPQKTMVLQWRQDLLSYFRSLESDEAQVLPMAMAENSFPELCEALSRFHGDKAAVRAAELLKTWVLAGMITKLEYADIT